MIKNIIFDLSYTLVFRIDGSHETLNDYHDQISNSPDFQFYDHFYIHQTTFELLRKLSITKNLLVLTSGDFQEDPAFRPLLDDIFKKVYSAQSIGISKSDPTIYRHVLSAENLQPHETLFIDDLQKNIKAAEVIGLKTHRYTDENELRIILNKLLTADTE